MRKKRLLSALMVLAMAISLVPVQVLAAFDDGSWGYYFYNTTDGSLSEEVQVYYSTDGETLTPLAHGDTAFVSSSDIQWDRVNAIVFTSPSQRMPKMRALRLPQTTKKER